MNAFIVDLKNRPGEVATVAEALATKGINITGFTGATCGDSGTVVLTTSDEAATRRALTDAGHTYRETELILVGVPDQPGSLAKVTRKLADAKVNIEAALPIGMSGTTHHVAFATDDPAKARNAVSEWLLLAPAGR
jgi:hypothetical protein